MAGVCGVGALRQAHPQVLDPEGPNCLFGDLGIGAEQENGLVHAWSETEHCAGFAREGDI